MKKIQIRMKRSGDEKSIFYSEMLYSCFLDHVKA